MSLERAPTASTAKVWEPLFGTHGTKRKPSLFEESIFPDFFFFFFSIPRAKIQQQESGTGESYRFSSVYLCLWLDVCRGEEKERKERSTVKISTGSTDNYGNYSHYGNSIVSFYIVRQRFGLSSRPPLRYDICRTAKSLRLEWLKDVTCNWELHRGNMHTPRGLEECVF